MPAPVIDSELPVMPWRDPAAWRLPGLQPLGPAPWLVVTPNHAGQMALRDDLVATRADRVHALLPRAEAAARECLDLVLDTLRPRPDYDISADAVRRPDGQSVEIDRDVPLLTAGRLVQEDICIMVEGDGAEHILGGAILCFPAGWTLSEKIGRPLTRIHAPIEEYDDDLARRVQRIFDGIRVGHPMWRANALLHGTAELHTPMLESARHAKAANPAYLRSERQTLRRLPATGAVVFTILTSVLRLADLSEDIRASIAAAGVRTSF